MALVVDFSKKQPTVAVGANLNAVMADKNKLWNERTLLWREKSGAYWSISEMETSHLRNVLRYLRRNAEYIYTKVEIGWLQMTWAMDTDDAPDDPAWSQSAVWNVRHYPIYQAMLTELQKRRREQRGLPMYIPRWTPLPDDPYPWNETPDAFSQRTELPF